MTSPPTDTSVIERLARHLAAGDPAGWPAFIEDAASIVALLKEPDAAMRNAGDDAMWRRMIDAALTERWSLDEAIGRAAMSPAPAGTDEEGDIALHADDSGTRDRAGWVHINPNTESRT